MPNFIAKAVNMAWFTDELLDQKRQIQDPLADEVIDQVITENGEAAARQLFNLLISRVELPLDQLPAACFSLVEKTNSLPDWVDYNQVKKADDMFLDHGPKFLLILYFKSLPLLYACKNGAQVLFRTGRLVHDPQKITIFTRRIAETAQFLIDVMSPDALLPGRKGIAMIQKIRLIHASIRRFMPKENWENQLLGRPINQEDMAITLMTFSVALLDGLHQFGIHESDEMDHAFFHTWMGIGSLLGIDNDLLPTSIEQGQVLLQKILSRQAAASPEGCQLARALVQFSESSIPGKIVDDSPELFIRYLAGHEIADMLGIKERIGCLNYLVPDLLFRIFGKAERLEEKSAHWKTSIDLLSQKLVIAMMQYFDNYKQSNFRIPPEMQQQWGIK